MVSRTGYLRWLCKANCSEEFYWDFVGRLIEDVTFRFRVEIVILSILEARLECEKKLIVSPAKDVDKDSVLASLKFTRRPDGL